MTVEPTGSPQGASGAPGTQALASATGSEEQGPQLEWLGGELQRRLRRAAAASGMTLAALCEQWLREGLERFEADQASDDPDGSGRCSLRTGVCTAGPVPLPVQQ